MKQRVNLTIDPALVHQAHKLAHEMHTSVSQLVEDSLRRLTRTADHRNESFVKKWRGKLKLARRNPSDPRREYLLKRYDLLKNADSH